MADVNTRAIERKLDRIRSLGLEELRLEWRGLYHSDAPRISRDLLILGLGYRLQEIEQGGLGKATRRKLQTIAKALRTTGRVGATPSLSLKPAPPTFICSCGCPGWHPTSPPQLSTVANRNNSAPKR